MTGSINQHEFVVVFWNQRPGSPFASRPIPRYAGARRGPPAIALLARPVVVTGPRHYLDVGPHMHVTPRVEFSPAEASRGSLDFPRFSPVNPSGGPQFVQLEAFDLSRNQGFSMPNGESRFSRVSSLNLQACGSGSPRATV